jgi:glutathione S-transferase
MSRELTLFTIGTSRTMRAHRTLLELDLDYESRPIQSRSGETLTDQFRRLTPGTRSHKR